MKPLKMYLLSRVKRKSKTEEPSYIAFMKYILILLASIAFDTTPYERQLAY